MWRLQWTPQHDVVLEVEAVAGEVREDFEPPAPVLEHVPRRVERGMVKVGEGTAHERVFRYEQDPILLELVAPLSRVCRELANFILAQGYEAETYPGPYAKQLNMIPAAIAAGLGQLGKHGSMINRTYGSSFRLSAVSTDMPLISDGPDEFGSEDFCMSCQLCVKECPPGAISDEKQMVRGVEKWYVDFDKCIPYFGEALACGICLAVCPWSRPGTGPKLAEKMLTRRARKAGDVHG